MAEAYLEYLYSPVGQEIAAKNFYRPRDKNIAIKYSKQFPELNLFTIDKFSGWDEAHKKHFSQGGIFDQLSKGSLKMRQKSEIYSFLLLST